MTTIEEVVVELLNTGSTSAKRTLLDQCHDRGLVEIRAGDKHVLTSKGKAMALDAMNKQPIRGVAHTGIHAVAGSRVTCVPRS